jgi:hypothetical protein
MGVANFPQAGAGRWCEVEKCGFLCAIQNWGPKHLTFFHKVFLVQNWAILSWGLISPSIQWKYNWGKWARVAWVTGNLLIFGPPNAPTPISPCQPWALPPSLITLFRPVCDLFRLAAFFFKFWILCSTVLELGQTDTPEDMSGLSFRGSQGAPHNPFDFEIFTGEVWKVKVCHNFFQCNIHPFCPGDYLCSSRPSIQWWKSWGKWTRRGRVMSDLQGLGLFFPSGAHNHVCRPIHDPFLLARLFYVILDPLFSGARMRANRHSQPEIWAIYCFGVTLAWVGWGWRMV